MTTRKKKRRWLIRFLIIGFFATACLGLLKDKNKVIQRHVTQSNEAVIEVYAARTLGFKGNFSVHTWIQFKEKGEQQFKRYEIVGWQLRWRDTALRMRNDSGKNPDWFGQKGVLLKTIHGKEAQTLIPKIKAAINNYPYLDQYRLWPGPNSNTFIAYLGLSVPELHLDLPATAIGKDYRIFSNTLGHSISGTGFQASLFGLAGVTLSKEEGLELNLLSLNVEWDLFDLAIELPVIGRIGGRP